MPRTVKECLKRNVFAVEEGLLLGRPQDLLIDPEMHKVAVMVLAMRGHTQVATIIQGSDVRSYTEDTIPVSGLSSVHLAYQVPDSHAVVEKGLQFQGRDVITSAGHNAGRIVDVLLNDDGSVIEYRVSKGWLRRLLRLTRPLLPAQLQTAGGEVAVVAEEESQEEG